ncbi:MAG: endonuclease III [Actinomycetota bacterium]|nr:endonuclease III [Actinomycetota bacterium]
MADPRDKQGGEQPAPIGEVLSRLGEAYPDAQTELRWETPLDLLVATMLSAQSTDVRVNGVTEHLFEHYRTAEDYARADGGRLEEEIRPVGFFRNKARALIEMGRTLVEEHGGEVPRTMEALVRLPGVGRKTANVVLGNAFSIDEGVVVDTHVRRLSNRLGLSREHDPEKIERDLIPLVPEGERTLFSHLLIFHGRRICKARKPDCPNCILNDICPSAFEV